MNRPRGVYSHTCHLYFLRGISVYYPTWLLGRNVSGMGGTSLYVSWSLWGRLPLAIQLPSSVSLWPNRLFWYTWGFWTSLQIPPRFHTMLTSSSAPCQGLVCSRNPPSHLIAPLTEAGLSSRSRHQCLPRRLCCRPMGSQVGFSLLLCPLLVWRCSRVWSCQPSNVHRCTSLCRRRQLGLPRHQ